MAGNIAKRANGKWRARYRDGAGNERARPIASSTTSWPSFTESWTCCWIRSTVSH